MKRKMFSFVKWQHLIRPIVIIIISDSKEKRCAGSLFPGQYEQYTGVYN